VLGVVGGDLSLARVLAAAFAWRNGRPQDARGLLEDTVQDGSEPSTTLRRLIERALAGHEVAASPAEAGVHPMVAAVCHILRR